MEQVVFKAKQGNLWIKAEVVRKVEGGYILELTGTMKGKPFFIEDSNVLQLFETKAA